MSYENHEESPVVSPWKDAIETIERLVKQAETPVLFHEDAVNKHFAANGERFEVELPVLNYTIELHHANDLVDFIRFEKRMDSTVSVFVAPLVEAELNWDNYHLHTRRATMRLTPSPEHMALKELITGVTHQRLYRNLYGFLYGCGADDLTAQVRNLRLSKSEEENLKIDDVGIRSSSGKQTVVLKTVAATGEQERSIDVEWQFEIPLWEEFDKKYTIRTRLEVDNSAKPMVFRFHPQGYERIVRQAMSDLRDYIVEGAPGIKAYLGSFG